MADQTFAVHCGFFDAIDSDRTYSADEMNRPYRRVISNGVFATPQGNPSTDLQVVESSGMNIICKAGEGLFADKWFENPSSIVITVPNNTSTVPRIDSVLVQVDTRTSGRVGNIVYRTGTPASSPTPPAINQTEGVVEYRLANIRVNAGVTSIMGRYITDRRGSSDCPWVTSLIYQVDTSTLYDQWQAAYAEYFEEEKAIWDAWYAQLTEDLDVSMTLDRHTNTVTTTATTTGTIPIGLAYNHNTDILEVYINGLRAIEGTHYIVVNDDTSIQVENQLDIGQAVTFVVMRSVISGSATNIMVLLQELESQIAGIAGGTPTVVDSKSAMTEHDKIYILSSDGKWYYYSATQEDWVIGGTYGGVPTDTTLSVSGSAADAKAVGEALADKADSADVTALDTRVTAVEGDVDDLNEDLKETGLYYDYDFANATNGYFIDAAGVVKENESFSVSDVIHVKNGQIIVFTGRGYLNSVAMISSVANGVYTPLVMSIDSTDQTYTYQADSDIDIALSYRTANTHECNIYTDITKTNERISNIVETAKDELGLFYEYDFANATSGHYIDSYGVYSNNDSFSVSDIIHVKNGQIVVFNGRGYLTSVAMIAEVNNGIYIPLVNSIDSTDRTYTYQATKDIDIVLSYRTASIHICTIYNNIPAIIEGVESKSNTITIDLSDSITGKVIDIYGVYSNNGNYSVSKPFYIGKGDVLQITATGYQNSTAILSEDNGGVYVPLVPSATGVTEYSYTATRSMKVVMCYRTANTHECTQTFNYNPVEVERDIYDLQNPELEYLYLFHKMAGIGDSLMSGELYYSDDNHRDAYAYSWLSNLARYGNAECVHYSVGGMTTKAWLDDVGGCRTALENETEMSNVYFIGLGTNDKNQQVYPIGNASDTAGTASFAGYYKQIIEIIHTHNPNAYIFCLSMYDSLSASIPYSNIVEDIAELYSYCYFIDFASNTKHTPKTTDYYAQNSHYTSIGYLYAAQLIKQLIETIVRNNKGAFKWIGLND